MPQAQVYRAVHLLDVVRQFLPAQEPEPSRDGWARVVAQPRSDAGRYPDLADVKGQAGAKRALEIAAAGGHSLLLVGPPGSGKSMLAQRFAGLLPPMTVDEALESAAIASLAGQLRAGSTGACGPPAPAPHRQRRGAGGRRLAAAAGRDLAGAPRRAVPRRAARVSARRAGGLARTAGDRPDHDLARGAARGVPGPLPVRRRDEPLPLRLAAARRTRPAAARPTRSRATRAS